MLELKCHTMCLHVHDLDPRQVRGHQRFLQPCTACRNLGLHSDLQHPPPATFVLDASFLLQVDGVLLSHPQVTEAVAFGAPDEKFGETVAAAVVPSGSVNDQEAFIADLKKHAASRLAKFKVRAS